METYLIGICDRLHGVAPIVAAITALLSTIFAVVFFNSQYDIGAYWATESDYKLNKVSKNGLITCLVVFIIIFLLYIFVPTGEEVSLMIQE